MSWAYYEDEWYDDDYDDDNSWSPIDWLHFAHWQDDEGLMWFCDECNEWHITRAGEALDANYADVFPFAPYIMYRDANGVGCHWWE